MGPAAMKKAVTPPGRSRKPTSAPGFSERKRKKEATRCHRQHRQRVKYDSDELAELLAARCVTMTWWSRYTAEGPDTAEREQRKVKSKP
eukprot:2926254-Rhodomonas_salina.2